MLSKNGNSIFTNQSFTGCWLAGIADYWHGTSINANSLNITTCQFDMMSANEEYDDMRQELENKWLIPFVEANRHYSLYGYRFGVLVGPQNEGAELTGNEFWGPNYYHQDDTPLWHKQAAYMHLNQAISQPTTTTHKLENNSFWGIEHGIWLMGGAYSRPYSITENKLFDLGYCLKLDRSVAEADVEGAHSIRYRCNQMRKDCALEYQLGVSGNNDASEDWCWKNGSFLQQGFVPETYGIFLTEGAKSLDIGICDANGTGGDPEKQPGGNRWPVGNSDNANQTGQISPYRWKSLYNENFNAGGSQLLKYIRYINEFVGTEYLTGGPEVIDAFGPNDPSLGGTSYNHCVVTTGDLIAQNYDPQDPDAEYSTGCQGISYIYFPLRPGHTPGETTTANTRGKMLKDKTLAVPNPANTRVQILYPRTLKYRTIELFEVGTGKRLEIKPELTDNSTVEFDLKTLANGVYGVRLICIDGTKETLKIVVIH